MSEHYGTDAVQKIIEEAGEFAGVLVKSYADDEKIGGIGEFLSVGKEGGELVIALINRSRDAANELGDLSESESQRLSSDIKDRVVSTLKESSLSDDAINAIANASEELLLGLVKLGNAVRGFGNAASLLRNE